MYIFQATRPHLAYAISTLSCFNNNYEDIHWRAVKDVLRYLQETKNLKLCYKKSSGSIIEGHLMPVFQNILTILDQLLEMFLYPRMAR